MMGHPVPHDLPLWCLGPPYQFDVVHVSGIGSRKRRGAAKREPAVHRDLGELPKESEPNPAFPRPGRQGERGVSSGEPILQSLSFHQDVATILTGDFNVPDTHAAWDDLLKTRHWRDPRQTYQEEEGQPMPTCWPSNGPPSRLDYFIVNNMCVTHVKGAGRDLQAHIPVHVPITLDMDMEAAPIRTVRLPAEIPIPDVGFRLTLPTVQEFQDVQAHLERCIQSRDLDAAYLTWSAFWEGVLVKSVRITKPEQAYLGRGKEPQPVMLYPKSPRKLVTTEREAFLVNLMGI